MSCRRNRPSTWLALLTMVLIFVSLPPSWLAFGKENSPSNNPAAQVDLLLNNLTPEERVGQLFLVTFQGSSVGPDLPVYDLIHEHHIGGLVLLSRNDNIVPLNGDTRTIPQQVQKLVDQLQQTESESSRQSQINPASGLSYLPNYIPLFIAIPQEGNGYPYDQILKGLTELPNQMAIGATWDSDLSTQVGTVAGKELSALGVNLLLGPSLDVLDLPQIEITKNLGTRTFGGDPYWVGEMGRAYIRGVHTGSEGKIAVAAKHFPGYGGSDRLPEEEVSTVRKSLDELKSIDLAPFIAVTGNALTAEETADAMLSSHIRYQGLQGTIRTTTRPVSLDPQALSLLMDLPGLANWRQNGGILISDDLGNKAIRRFYALTNQSFDPRRVALNAFLAGNDILYIADFSTSNDPDNYSETLRTLEFFAQKYREDSAFAQRVDESVRRILTLKSRLYPDLSFEAVRPNPEKLQEVGQSSAVTFDVARNSATLLSPAQAELDTTMPDPPNQNDRIVFIVDNHTAQQCTSCSPYEVLSQQSLQEAVVKLYGPQAGGLVSTLNLSSYSYEDLARLLNARAEAPDLERDLSRAHWIILVAINDTGSTSSFEVMKRFLAERPDLFQQKRLIVFALTAPYYLDATNISKLTAYYALYSKAPPFIDIAAYLLFGELRTTGASPISVPGINYRLNDELFPDPKLVIPLEIDIPIPQQPVTTTTTAVPFTPEYRIGDVIPLRAGTIVDFNGNPVPDGTPVNFVFSFGGDSLSVRQTAFTQKGIARTTYAVMSAGALEISAESENARSQSLNVDIPSPTGEETIPSPTVEPSQIPTPVAPTQSPPAAPVTSTPEVEAVEKPGIGEWILALMLSLGVSVGIYRLAAQIKRYRWGLRAGLLGLIGGLFAYIGFMMNLPGSQVLGEISSPWNILLSSSIGISIGVIIALVWLLVSNTIQNNKN